MLRATDSDGFLVVHDGAVALEWLVDGMTPATPHLLQSVSKSLTATLAGRTTARHRQRGASTSSRSTGRRLSTGTWWVVTG